MIGEARPDPVASRHPLAGRHIVVTRPAAQGEGLSQSIAAAGGIPVPFPVLSISEIGDKRPLVEIANRLDRVDLAVFVSPNAVEHALAVILALRCWPSGLPVATMGESSQRALARHGLSNVIAPQSRQDSEALLAMPALSEPAVRGKRVVIFRGDGGRELLGRTLADRGASVEYVTCYHRARPSLDPDELLCLWAEGRLDAITVTSSEGLRNLAEMVGAEGRDRLRRTRLFVPHERIAEQARALGLERVFLTAPGDAGLLAGLMAHFDKRHDD
jgi:uroporphyrinogen-III synthase